MTLRIEESYLDKFRRALRSVAKKAAKSGSICTWEEKETSFKEIIVDGKSSIFKIHTFEAESLPAYGDWRVVAQIEHLPEGNVVKEFTDAKVPEVYRSRPGVCDHCGVGRPRKITYIVENTKEGIFVQLGRSCVGLYTGCVQLLDGVLPLLSLEKYDVDHMDADLLISVSEQSYLPTESAWLHGLLRVWRNMATSRQGLKTEKKICFQLIGEFLTTWELAQRKEILSPRKLTMKEFLKFLNGHPSTQKIIPSSLMSMLC